VPRETTRRARAAPSRAYLLRPSPPPRWLSRSGTRRGRGTFTHSLAWDIAATARGLRAGQRAPREGTNDAGRIGCTGPCPPSGNHRYVFRLYALEAPLTLARGASRAQFLAALRGRSLAVARLVGRYGR